MNKLLLFLVSLVSLGPSVLAQTLGAVIEGSHHKADCNINVGMGCVVIHVVNRSDKMISAFAVSGPAPVHTVGPSGQVTTEFKPGVMSSSRNDYLTMALLSGYGGFAPGASQDLEFPEQPAGPLQVTVDVVTYFDGTAEVLNEKAFEQIIADRKAEVEDAQKIVSVINSVLATHSEHPTESVIAQLRTDDGRFSRTINNELSEITKTPQNGWDWESGQLKALAQAYERFIPAMEQQTHLTKVVLK